MTKDRALTILGPWIDQDLRLQSDFPSLQWKPGDESVELDGVFTVDELEALAWWVQHYEECLDYGQRNLGCP